MNKCILCGQPTTGSVGAAGIHWASICQACKDKADKELMVKAEYEAKVLGYVFERLFDNEPRKSP